VRGAVLLAGLLLAWLAGYVTGVFPWLGSEWATTRSTSAGNITIAGEERVRGSFGFSEFFFLEGQEVFIDYEVEVRAGSLFLHVFRSLTVGEGSATHYVAESGRGRFRTTIPRTGFYVISASPSVVRGPGVGWDLTYDVAWGAKMTASR